VEDRKVVFVAEGDGFEARPVVLGRGDGQVREVLRGLSAGESYVAANSFILKSELGKEGAEHGH
jgi:cobalt-zinc-cadmium efflux system membrane fusion protein